MQREVGFQPVYDENSRLLILGSFPSVKSRRVDFYYGNKQNRFWRTVCGYFHEEVPPTTEGKKEFLYRRNIALWDMAMACDIQGSSDASVKNVELADLNVVLSKANIQAIFLNGSLAYELFLQGYADSKIPYKKLPSTSPANPRFTKEAWEEALDDVFAVSR